MDTMLWAIEEVVSTSVDKCRLVVDASPGWILLSCKGYLTLGGGGGVLSRLCWCICAMCGSSFWDHAHLRMDHDSLGVDRARDAALERTSMLYCTVYHLFIYLIVTYALVSLAGYLFEVNSPAVLS